MPDSACGFAVPRRPAESPETAARLHPIAECASAGRLPAHSELSLFERMPTRYGQELAELERPEPW